VCACVLHCVCVCIAVCVCGRFSVCVCDAVCVYALHMCECVSVLQCVFRICV